MTIYNLGSINIDHFYSVPRLPAAGETLAADAYASGLGGKGANQSVAAALAGADVKHIGAVGPDGDRALRQLAGFGVDTGHIQQLETPTGHAIVTIDPMGENAIIIHAGANRALKAADVERALMTATQDDWLILQNETSCQVEAAQIASAKGVHVVYSAAPFDFAAVQTILSHVALLIMNAVEADQLSLALGIAVQDIPVPTLLITQGADGATWINRVTGETVTIPAFPVTPVDTTGAGDTFAGYTIAGLSQSLDPHQALTRASAAAALQIQRKGTAEAIPTLETVLKFLA